MSKDQAVLNFSDQSLELPVHSPTLGYDTVEVKNLGKHGLYTFDPGFYSTAACESKITYIDGDKGILLHRGYPIDQLAYQTDFMEVCHLLMHGELPNIQQKQKFIETIKSYTSIDPSIIKLYESFSQDAHPMAMLLSAMGGLSALYHGKIDIHNPEQREQAAMQLIAKVPILAAMGYRHSQNQALMAPDISLDYAANFLHMTFGSAPKEPVNPVLARAMDRIFILHADHEQNASTSVVRATGSTDADPLAAIASGVAALWGPAHGGANEACLRMLKEIGDESRIEHYIQRAKDPNDHFRLMGFGHRVYKNYDPRAKVMQETCHEILETLGRKDEPLFKLALKLEKIALEDPYFAERKLYPNVDFYSGLTLSALGVPTTMFTVIFALARCSGWISHWMEMLSSPDHSIARPRQLYTGSVERQVLSQGERK